MHLIAGPLQEREPELSANQWLCYNLPHEFKMQILWEYELRLGLHSFADAET